MRVLFDVCALGAAPNGSTVNGLLSAHAVAVARPDWEIGLRTLPVQRGLVEHLLPEQSPVRMTLAAPDVVHFPHQVPAADLSHARARFHVPISTTWLDFIELRRPEYFQNVRSWASAVERAALTLADVDGIAWLSDVVAGQASTFGWGARVPSAVTGIGLDHLREDRDDSGVSSRAREAIKDGPYILMVAASFPHKRRLLALEALAAARRQGLSLNLVLAGSEAPHWLSTRPAEKALTRELGLGEHVRDMGSLTTPDMTFLYRHAVGSLALSEEEGFGMVPFESTVLGCPCVTTSGSTATPIIHSLSTGDSPEEVAASLLRLEDPTVRLASLARITELARLHTWADTGRRLSETLAEVVSVTPKQKPSRFPAMPLKAHRAAWKLHPWLGSQLGRTRAVNAPRPNRNIAAGSI